MTAPFPVALAAELGRIVGRAQVLSRRLDRELYAYDAGTAEGLPDLVVLPADVAQLIGVLELCGRRGVAAIPRGAGTCLSGGPIAPSGGVVVVLTRLDRILALDPESRVAVVEPGVVNKDLQQAAARHGLTFPPDPASFSVSTLGGNAAENAGGPHAFRHGVFRQHVLGLEYVLPDGSLGVAGHLDPVPCADLPRPLLELLPLLVGSEGTLCFLTKLALRLERLEPAAATVLGLFASAEATGVAVSSIVAHGLEPAALEVMGQLELRLVDQALSLRAPPEAAAMLLFEVEGPGPGLARQADLAARLMRAAGALRVEIAAPDGGQASGPDSAAGERERLWGARRTATGLYGRLKPNYLSQDVVVPRQSMSLMFRKLDELGRASGLPLGMVGHAGDGNLHPAALFDPAVPGEAEEAAAVCRALVEEALRLGGSITGEHGVGVEKLEYMPRAFSPATLGYFAAIKRAFDPRGLLNPGKLVWPVAEGATGPQAGAVRPGSAPEAALGELQATLGEGLRTSQADLCSFGFGPLRRPLAVALPATDNELVEAVRILAAHRVPVWPVGGGGLVRVAMRPFAPGTGVAVSTARLRRVLELEPDNQTATLEAGVNLEELNASLALSPATCGGEGAGLCYPVDPWRTPGSTLGGEIGSNACGPGRPRYGSTRDRLLGLCFVDARGQLCRVGGRTVKDVSGYDVTRLLAGSWGTLGVVVRATIRLAPRPELERTISLAVPGGALGRADALLTDLRRGVSSSALQLSSPASPGEPWRLLVALGGVAEDVALWEQTVRERAFAHGFEARGLTRSEAAAAWAEARTRLGPALCRQWASSDGPWLAGYATTSLPAVAALAALVFERARESGGEQVVSAYCSLGVVDFGVRAVAHAWRPARVADLAPGALSSGEYGRAPDTEEGQGPPPGPAEGGYGAVTARTVRALKEALDPWGILAPASRALPPPPGFSRSGRGLDGGAGRSG